MLPPLVIRLFGQFEVRVDESPLPPLRTAKGRWLLALLALRAGSAVDRTWLAGTLWPDSSDEDASGNLRRSLTDLRSALGSAAGLVYSPTPRTLALELRAARVDVLEFDHAARQQEIDSMRRALDLYRGALLEGCGEVWAVQEREARELAALSMLDRLADIELEARRPAEAAALLRRGVAIDPLREHNYCALMAALAETGDYAAAHSVYRELRTLLRRELNTEPAAATTAVYQELRQRAQVTGATAARAAASGAPRSRPAPPQHGTTLVGRADDIAEVLGLLKSQSLISLTGAGGIGKTRLAAEVAHRLERERPGAAAFVGLSAMDDGALLLPAIASMLGVGAGAADALDVICNYLHDRELLLVLDNCEHLLPACRELVCALLEECGRLRILVTTRQPLGVYGELVWEVGPLAAPDVTELSSKALGAGATIPQRGVEHWLAYDAVRLYSDRATRTDRAFQLTTRNAPAVARVCEIANGVPLIIELAAAWSGTLTPDQIAARLDRPLDMLVDRGGALGARHSGAAAAAEWSFRLLTPDLQRLFARLSVFRGGWSLESAEAVCAASAAQVADLRDRSMVTADARDTEMRYRMLHVLRAFANEQLTDSERHETAARHAIHYAVLAQKAASHLSGPDQLEWIRALDSERDNLRTAIAYALSARDTTTALTLGAALGAYWWRRGYWTEGRRHLAAILQLAECTKFGVDQRTYGSVLCAAGWLAAEQGDQDEASALLCSALESGREAGDVQGTARALLGQGMVALDRRDTGAALRQYSECMKLGVYGLGEAEIAQACRGLAFVAFRERDSAEARRLAQEALTRASDAADTRGMAASLMTLGFIAADQEQVAPARRYLDAAIELYEQLGDQRGIALTLNNRSECELVAGEHSQAALLAERGLMLWRELGHPYGIGEALVALGDALRAAGDVTGARVHYAEALRLYGRLDAPGRIAYILVCQAEDSLLQGAAEYAAALCGAARSVAGDRRREMRRRNRALCASLLRSARAAIGAPAARRAWIRGRSQVAATFQ